jgi:hypothetical protein
MNAVLTPALVLVNLDVLGSQYTKGSVALDTSVLHMSLYVGLPSRAATSVLQLQATTEQFLERRPVTVAINRRRLQTEFLRFNDAKYRIENHFPLIVHLSDNVRVVKDVHSEINPRYSHSFVHLK